MIVVRTCVGCGGRDEKRLMRRIVRTGGRLELDLAQRRPGRGAYLHPASACIDAWRRRRGAVRSLRWSPPVVERARLAAVLTSPTGAR